MRDDLNVAFPMLLELAAQLDLDLYNVLHRNAGWAIQWWDQSRVTEPEPVLDDSMSAVEQLTLHSNWMSRVTKEGLVVVTYHETFQACVAAEVDRLEELLRQHRRE